MDKQVLTIEYELSKNAQKSLSEIATANDFIEPYMPWQKTLWLSIALIGLGKYGQSKFSLSIMFWRLSQMLIIGAYILPLFASKWLNRKMDTSSTHSLSARMDDPTLVGKHRVTITESYIEEFSAGYLNRMHWSAISDIKLIEPVFIFEMETNSSIILPMFAFEHAHDCQQFMDQAAAFWQQAKNAGQQVLAAPFKTGDAQPSRVVYALTKDDVLAVQLHSFQWPESKRFFRLMHLAVAAPGLCGLGYWWYSGFATPTQSLFLLLGFGLINTYAWFDRCKMFEKGARDVAAKARPGDGILGRHTIWLSPHELIEMTDSNLTKRGWGLINRVAESPQFFHIYCSDAQSFVVPKRIFASTQEAATFLRTVNQFIQVGKAGQTGQVGNIRQAENAIPV